MSTNTEHEILATKSGPVLHVTLNRPAVLNALSHHMIQDLRRALSEGAAEHSASHATVSATPAEFTTTAPALAVTFMTLLSAL